MPRSAEEPSEAAEPAPYRPKKIGPPGPGPPKRPSRWVDRIIGVVLGLLLGIGVIIVFVFKGSEGTIDAPRISGINTGQPRPGLPLGQPKLQLVRVIGGAPPASGPVRLDFKQGRQARFLVDSDAAVGIEIPGYGISRTVGAGRTLVSFTAARRGQYPVVVSASHIDIANLNVTRP